MVYASTVLEEYVLHLRNILPHDALFAAAKTLGVVC